MCSVVCYLCMDDVVLSIAPAIDIGVVFYICTEFMESNTRTFLGQKRVVKPTAIRQDGCCVVSLNGETIGKIVTRIHIKKTQLGFFLASLANRVCKKPAVMRNTDEADVRGMVCAHRV